LGNLLGFGKERLQQNFSFRFALEKIGLEKNKKTEDSIGKLMVEAFFNV